MPDIPLIVDDIKQLDGFDMTRCVYFHIECEDTLDPWTLGTNGGRTPFLMLGLSGIIMQPLNGATVFESPGQLDELFATIENVRREGRDEPQLNVEIADVWVPNQLLGGRTAVRGDVYRVKLGLLQAATAFTAGRIGYETFVRTAVERRQEFVFSEHETKVISDWAIRTIARSRESRHPDLYLPGTDRNT